MLKEFKEFAIKGNVIDLAVAVIIGGAFGKIVSSFVQDIIMPVLSLLTGKIDFASLFISLNGTPYNTIAEAKEAGAATLNYGLFITSVIDFVLIAFSIFIVIKLLIRKKEEAPAPAAEVTTKVCPFCQSTISLKATRCAHCTSILE